MHLDGPRGSGAAAAGVWPARVAGQCLV